MKRILFYCCMLLCAALSAKAQDDAMVKSIQYRFGLYAEKALQEKMYVHLDRPLYLIGETIWFKAYNLNASSHQFVDVSKVAYLEVLDAENNALIQTKFSLAEGKGDGSILIPSTIASGKYKVRCYTNWMKNYGPEYFFESSISIVNPFVRFDPDRLAKEAEKYDVQFFPEGGYLVQGIESKVAFRAIGKEGTGISFIGDIVNSQNESITKFQPEKNGIGFFTLKPESGTTYNAVIKDGKGQQFTFPLPKAEERGYVMQLKDSTNKLLKVTVTATVVSDEPVPVYLMSHTRQLNASADRKYLKNNKAVFVLDKSKLGEGISHITIFNEKLKPLCERLYFKRPAKELAIEATIKNAFVTREKVNMDISAAVSSARASELANVSVAVYLADSIVSQPQSDITSHLWLSSDLKGSVESPEYYFSNNNADTDRQLDNLMLTHGWRRFKWENVFVGQAVPFEFLPEFDGHLIQGRVINKIDSTPAKGVDTYLAALDFPARLYVAQSDQKGNVMYEVRKFTGPKEITLQTNLNMDSTHRIEIASPFFKQFATRPLAPFVFSKTWENQLLTRAINMQTANVFLPPVVVEQKATLADSVAFFGVPDEKYFLDDFTRFPTMEEVLREYVRGVLVRKRQKEFHFRMVDKLLPNTFYTTDPLVLLDGIPIFDTDKIMEMDPLKIKKIEVLNSRYFLGPMTFTGIASFSTYRNDLAGFELDPKVTVIPYEGVQVQREFYSPRYDKGNADSRIPDFRNLLHWAPNITTDASGKAKLDFYTSDQTGRYQVVIQGITPSGVSGSKTLSFNVGKSSL
ncbi:MULTISPECIES: hypothetical protein [Dyadobacter]|uniref:MG2 domain-containing protein n=1 Tax=Dyadobacter chenhuakuii TaxID=2909339 RepID=A0ABY4XFK2_9BACT|nr:MULTISPECIES: hypothetical protein [Dyadobacter]MCF2495166.1 hypothetical protein [Dyadobacter chenhuakuii]MCF2516251.1 hypothetical protein [Dyadobacter sp. CY351]USJ29209.1 hypothetical protein NFI80_15135 [Dyadobacter chenhuakuii]